MLTQNQIETMRALAEKTLDGPTDPTAVQDLTDALAYAAEIEADPTPPTSAMHRWLVALTRALRATGKERDEARMLADSHLRDLQGAQERLTTLGDVLAKARGTAEDGPDALWFVVHNRDGRMVVEPFKGVGARRAAHVVARGHAAGWSEVYVMQAHEVRSDDADGDVLVSDLANGATLGAFLDAICERLGMPDAHLIRFPTNVPDGRGGAEPALWWSLADGEGKPIRVGDGNGQRHYWAGATKGEALMSAWGEIP